MKKTKLYILKLKLEHGYDIDVPSVFKMLDDMLDKKCDLCGFSGHRWDQCWIKQVSFDRSR